MVSVVYSDDTWDHQRGFRFALSESGVVKAEELSAMISRDDPHSGIRPAVGMLLETELGVVDLMANSKTEYPLEEGTEFCIQIHRKVEANAKLCEPVIMEVGATESGELSFSLPTLSQSFGSSNSRTRGRGRAHLRPENDDFPSTCSGMGLRYFDEILQAFVRVPHGGVIQKEYRPADNNYQIALELTPLSAPPVTPPGSFRYSLSADDLQMNDSFTENRSESQQIKVAYEQMELEAQYLERIQKCKKGIDKEVVRAGIPDSHRSEFFKTVFGLTADKINRIEGEYRKAFDSTFQWQAIEDDTSFVPKPHLFGADETFSLAYFELTPSQERQFYLILSVLISSHAYLYNPSIPVIVAMLLGYLRPALIWDVVLNFFLVSDKHKIVDHSGATKGSLAVCSKQLQEMIKAKASGFHQRFKSLATEATAAELIVPWFGKLLCGSGFPLYFTKNLFDMYCVEGSKIYYRVVLSTLRHIDTVASRKPETDIIGLLKNCAPVTSSRIVNNCFGISLKRKELNNKKKISAEGQEMFVNLMNKVVMRPKIASPSNIINHPMKWEEIYSWVPTTACRSRLLRKVYEKSRDGSLLSSVKLKTDSLDSDTPCLLLMHLSSDAKKCQSTSKKVIRQCEVVGFYLSSPMGGDSTSFGFRISPIPSVIKIPDMTEGCRLTKTDCYLGVASSNYLLNFSDSSLESGRSNPPSGIPKVCSGHFNVINLEVFAFVDE
eukprot:TRINITY_DN5896_c0_g1_i1.p1 TRINITY_DN5896_c0_g1~~TRINITY_DN5896_c0_g1_i1.p1  ORF type:complete len:720 (+),score=145.39 TRINITY_DN5896_c0_g1_i1:59-2218(+)